MSNKPVTFGGLDGIIAGISSICEVDEDHSELFYYGYSIKDLAENSTFEEVAYLLLKGNLPCKDELEDFSKELSEEREVTEQTVDVIKRLPKETDPMDVLKIAIDDLHTMDPDASSNTNEANARKAIRLIAKIPTIITINYHIIQGKKPIKPHPKLSHAANFLYMLNRKKPEDIKSNVLDKSLILYAEHEFNASTFVARVVASTLSDMHSAVIAAIAALKGQLHGGANERAMEMILEIRRPERAETWVKEALSKKKRIMGFGHRIYKKEDPRTPIIKKITKELGERLNENRWFVISQKIEDIMNVEKGLHANLDFYSSSAYYLLGIPIPLYTPIFAASRVTGWTAHIMEQYNDNRLIRPRAEYIGVERRKYVPLKDRD